MTRRSSVLLAVLTVALVGFLLPSRAALASPDDGWGAEFGTPGANGTVRALLTVGTDLYAAGTFTEVDGVPASRIARWDGSAWHAMGTGFNNTVNALALWQGNVVAAGLFTTADGNPALRIARWDGSAWQPIGTGIGNPVHALTVWNSLLIAGGTFNTAGGNAALNVAAWDGSAWAPLGSGLNGAVVGLDVYGGQLAAGGDFTASGAVSTGHVATWNGAAWSSVGNLTATEIRDIAVYQNKLWACGGCGWYGDWNGATWRAGYCSGSPYTNTVASGGDILLVGGNGVAASFEFGETIAGVSYEDAAQVSHGLGWLNGDIRAATRYGALLVFGGDFFGSQSVGSRGLIAWNGTTWQPLLASGTSNGLSKRPHCLGVLGSQVLVGGDLQRFGSTAGYGFGSWNGTSWTSQRPSFIDFTRYDGGDLVRPTLPYAGGLMVGGWYTMSASPGSANSLARWTGSGWSNQPPGLDFQLGNRGVDILGLYGGGLVAAGPFTKIGGVSARGIARYNGAAWSPLGNGISPAGIPGGMVEFQGQLYVTGGYYNASNQVVGALSRWDGSSWQTVPGSGSGINTLAVYNGLLYAGGTFASMGGQPGSRLAAFDGAAWHSVGTGVTGSQISSMVVHGGRLIIAGLFTAINGIPAANVAAFDGNSWQPLGSGTNGGVTEVKSTGDDLYLIGGFTLAGDEKSTFIARWRDQPVAVVAASVTASRDDSSCRLRWQVEADAASVAWRVSRELEDGGRLSVTDQRFVGVGPFEFIDTTAPDAHFDYWIEEIRRDGGSRWYGPYAVPAAPAAPLTMSVSANPFREAVTIQLSGAVPSSVTIRVFDPLGRQVRRLWSGDGATPERIEWDGRTDAGRPAAAGRYVVRAEHAGRVLTLPVVLIR